MSHTVKNEWVVDPWCTHHMGKYGTLFKRPNKDEEIRVYVVDDFFLDVSSWGDVAC
jgi:hypothetical protein